MSKQFLLYLKSSTSHLAMITQGYANGMPLPVLLFDKNGFPHVKQVPA